jgi:hypothetical protein
MVVMLSGLILLTVTSSCGYRYYTGLLKPAADVEQGVEMKVADDGTVTWVHERLEIGLRPMTDEELNRAFVTYSGAGGESTNPYTFADWKDPVTGKPPSRFTVFLLKVKNYTYPKIKVDPLKASILASNGRTYVPLSLDEMKEYYQPYVRAYAGNLYSQFEERKDILIKTLYVGNMIFSGQETEGYVVFPVLHHDIREITVYLKEVALRYDFRGEPVESVDLAYRFRRDTGRVDISTGEVHLEYRSGEEGK